MGEYAMLTLTMGHMRLLSCVDHVEPSNFVDLCHHAQISEVTSVTSILPGMLVQSLITAVQPVGLNLQVLGFFEGTVDQFHLLPGPVEKSYKTGRKVKARVLYTTSSTPPRFALSLAEHVVGLTARHVG